MSKRIIFISTIAVFLSIFSSVFVNQTNGSSKTDYEFQWSNYRGYYQEFLLLKNDYLKNPTLDNQQKSIISAKQTLLARDLAKSSYARFLTDSIINQNTQYQDLNPVLIRLNQATDFFDAKAKESQKIITPQNLKDFSLDYLKNYKSHEASFQYGQVANKVASLVRFQIDTYAEYLAMLPKLPSDLPVAVTKRIESVPVMADEINQKISTLTQKIIQEEDEVVLTNRIYLSKISGQIEEIRLLELKLVDMLRDIEINYVESKI